MKQYLIIIKLLLFPYILFGQGIISNQLNKKMLSSDGNDFLPITIQISDDLI